MRNMAVIFIGMGYVGTNDGFIMPGLICCIIMACMWLLGDDQDDDSDFGDKIKVPKAVFDYEDKNYAAMETLFKSAGFTNVKIKWKPKRSKRVFWILPGKMQKQ